MESAFAAIRKMNHSREQVQAVLPSDLAWISSVKSSIAQIFADVFSVRLIVPALQMF
ncbi:hypothetical protein B398_04425 [Xylella fastidiosa 32]|uniref:Uncharacterized protein n=1 Tax=Xylella fastidiosa (strain 9a5c) TaxID=160492 RepID=Q9PBK8_XYLFA|nr:hypothetical protein XF_2136 [Xylella fastidiosa 9a5c]ETE33515.1 hypothetical protein B398_04425 [Xylella fastidiosa 32]